MLNLRTASAFSLTVLIAATAGAEPKKVDVDIKKTTVVKQEKTVLDYDLDIDKSVRVKNDVDVHKKSIDDSFNSKKSIDDSFNTKKSIDDSFNYTTKKSIKDSFNHTTQISKSVFASPVAKGTLASAVTQNSVNAAAVGLLAVAMNESDASLSGSALSGFTGINSMNVNGGPNSSLQSNVSIAVVNTQY